MQKAIKLKIKAMSNLFIGGAPVPFEIGGIDQQTAVDQEKFPYIPGSSFKGALQAIIRKDNSDMGQKIKQLYAEYLKKKDTEDNWKTIQELVKEDEARKRIKKRYEEAFQDLSPVYLFGIKGFNDTPKLLFCDLLLCDKYRDIDSCFSIDMKNSLDNTGNVPVSNPRSYKAARSGLVFKGEILLYKMELLGENAEKLCKEYVIYNLRKFNNGIHRLGNSKSRGYGKIEVMI